MIKRSATFTLCLLFFIVIVFRILPHIKAVGSARYEAILVDFNINIDGGALHLWEKVLSTSRNRVIILKINSYGGYLSVADKIVLDIIDKNIRCYTWIPPGGYAISAAAMISLACERIFMGSGSVIGDAIPSPPEPKVVEYVASRFRALAERMFRDNEDLVRVAEDMVREGKTLTAEEAISMGFAFKAESTEDLEHNLDLRIVEVISPGIWDRFISMISLPIVSEILLIAGAVLIIVEILTTGFQGYAIAGVLLIILSLFGMNLVPPSLFALILILSGLILLAIEMYTPGFGVFGLSGVALLVIGIGYQLYITPPQLLTATVYVVLGGIATIAAIMGFIAFKAVEVMRRKRASIEQQLLSSIGIAKTDIYENTPGVVYVLGEDWTAYSVRGVIPSGSRVKVVRVEGLKVYVEKINE